MVRSQAAMERGRGGGGGEGIMRQIIGKKGLVGLEVGWSCRVGEEKIRL